MHIFANILAQKNCKAECNWRKAALFAFVQKHTCKMLMKLTPALTPAQDSLNTAQQGLTLPHLQTQTLAKK